MSLARGKYWVYTDNGWTLVDSTCIVHHDADISPLYPTPEPPPGSKPPLGLMPKKLWEERRAVDLCQAIQRYAEDGRTVPMEWVDELLQRITRGNVKNETRKV